MGTPADMDVNQHYSEANFQIIIRSTALEFIHTDRQGTSQSLEFKSTVSTETIADIQSIFISRKFKIENMTIKRVLMKMKESFKITQQDLRIARI